MKINPALSGTANVLGLIADANRNFRFTEASVSVTNVLGRVPDVVPYNSIATVVGKDPSAFVNPTDVYYNRRSMMEGTDAPTLLYQVDSSSTFDDVLTKICDQLRLVKSEMQLVDFRTPYGSTISTVTLTPIDNSLLYYPMKQDFSLSWNGSDIQNLVALFNMGDRLHKLLHVTMPAPGYY